MSNWNKQCEALPYIIYSLAKTEWRIDGVCCDFNPASCILDLHFCNKISAKQKYNTHAAKGYWAQFNSVMDKDGDVIVGGCKEMYKVYLVRGVANARYEEVMKSMINPQEMKVCSLLSGIKSRASQFRGMGNWLMFHRSPVLTFTKEPLMKHIGSRLRSSSRGNFGRYVAFDTLTETLYLIEATAKHEFVKRYFWFTLCQIDTANEQELKDVLVEAKKAVQLIKEFGAIYARSQREILNMERQLYSNIRTFVLYACLLFLQWYIQTCNCRNQ